MLVHRFDPTIPLPTFGSSHAAGFDLHLSHLDRPPAKHVTENPLPLGFERVDDDTWSIFPGGMAYAQSGLGFHIPADHFLDVRGRSGWTGVGLVVLAGVIDEDFLGNVGAHVVNLSHWPVKVKRGMRLFQAVLMRKGEDRGFEENEARWERLATPRGDKGFGSSGA